MKRSVRVGAACALALSVMLGVAGGRARAQDATPQMLHDRARSVFGTLPEVVPSADNPITDEKVKLGRMLFYENRISKSHQFSCNSCHRLDHYGVDNEPTSPGHGGVRGDRNSPTVFNAALHIAQFWDGRAADVEEQAKGPILNPVEMAMAADADVIGVLKSIPGYAPLFAAAFPGEEDPFSYDNVAKAIGAFERKLTTLGPLDRFIEGDLDALDDAQLAGLRTFLDTGCTTCHNGAAVGGGMYQKIGLVHPYETDDVGREKFTGNPADRYFFKVPSLRNIAETAPYFHDGTVEELPEAVRLMGWHQLGLELSDQKIAEIVTFLDALTGRVDADYVAKPELPASGPDTPPPDPS